MKPPPSDEDLGYPEISVVDGTSEGGVLPEPEEGGGFSDEDESRDATEADVLDIIGSASQFSDLPDEYMAGEELGPADSIYEE